MVNGTVPGQPRTRQRVGDCRARRTERSREEPSSLLERVELPEAVDDTHPEAARQEWPGALAPGAVLGPIAVEAGHVIPPVLVDREVPAAGAEHAVDLGELAAMDAAERRPQSEHHVRRGIRR